MSLDRLPEMSSNPDGAVLLSVDIASNAAGAQGTRLIPPAVDMLVCCDTPPAFPHGSGGHLADQHRSYWEQAAFTVHALPTASIAYRLIKRFTDIAIVLALSPLLLPLMLGIALMVACTSVGPILYRHRRVGQFGKEFHMWKFRSMHIHGDEILRDYLERNPSAAEEWRQSHKLKRDPRVTPIGRFLRCNSLDGLPQFINVLSGSMSLVGPRPIVDEEVRKYADSYFFYTSAKPGLSGLWQVSGRSNLSYDQRVVFDKTYVCGWSLAMDFSILLRTASAVWKKQGAL